MDLTLLDSILECSICLERLQNTSRVLPCQHTFCIDCLKRVLNKNPSTPLACPECRQQTNIFNIDSLPRNVFLIRLLDQFKPTNQNDQPEKKDENSSNKESTVQTNVPEIKQSSPVAKLTNDQQISTVPYAKALFDFHMNPLEDEGCLKFMKGMVIQVTRRVDQNWAEGKLGDNVGIFPLSFVHMNQSATTLMQSYARRLPVSITSNNPDQKPSTSASPLRKNQQPPLNPSTVSSNLIRPQSPSNSQSSSQILAPAAPLAQDKTGIYIALHNYTPKKPDELELKKGMQYIVKEACKDGWFKGVCIENLSIKGVFPGNYVMPLLYHQKMMSMQRNLQAQKQHANSCNAQLVRTSGAYTNLGLSSIPPELPQRNIANGSFQSSMSQPSISINDNLPAQSQQKTDDNVNKIKKETVTEMLMKRLGYNRKSTDSSAYSMDNPVFDDTSTPQHPLQHSHIRSGSCPIDLGLTNKNVENLQFGSQRVKIRERTSLQMPNPDTLATQKRHSINLSGPSSSRNHLQNSQIKVQHRKSSSLSLDTSLEPVINSTLTPERYRCVTKYPANSRFELSLNVGDIIILQKKRDNGWYKGELLRSGQIGLFPANFVELID